MEQFEGELKVSKIDTEQNKMDFLPLLLKGKAAYFSEALRTIATWSSMKSTFIQEFTIDPNVVIGELRAQRCNDFDVEGFTAKFMLSANKLNKSDPAIEA